MKTHHFQPDHENGPDHRGDYRCICGMPRGNKVHPPLPEKPSEDVSDRILGEAETVEA